MYLDIIRARIRSQRSYRTSFLMDCMGTILMQCTELVSILVLFSRVDSLGGFNASEVLLMYALASVAFGLADITVGQLDNLSTHIRKGNIDILLMRPLGALPQLLTLDVELRRLGRLVVGVIVLAYLLYTSDIHWTADKVILAGITPIAGAIIISSIWIASCSVSFWIVDGREVANAATYGTNLFTSYPVTVFTGWLRHIMAFVLPGAFVAYYPTLAIIQRSDPLGGPPILSWISPVIAVSTSAIAALIWRFALRNYQGTGS